MYCTNCGQHVADNTKFCWHCGKRIIQHNLTPTPEAIDDLVTNKAEEIMVQEDNISFSDLGTNDYVAKKASFTGEISPQSSSQTQRSPSIPISSQQFKDDDSIQLLKRNEIDKKDGIILIQEIQGATIHYYYVDSTTGDKTDYFNSSCSNYNDLIISFLNGKNGLFYFNINQGNTFEIILPCVYEEISKVGEDGNNTIYLLKKKGKFGLFSFNSLKNNPSKIILPCTYDEIKIEEPPIGLNIIKQDGKYGLFHNYHSILPCIYDKIRKIEDIPDYGKIYEMTKEGKYGYIYYSDEKNLNIISCVLSKKIDFRFTGEFVIYKGVKYRIDLHTGDLFSTQCSNISKILSSLIKIIVLWPSITYIFIYAKLLQKSEMRK